MRDCRTVIKEILNIIPKYQFNFIDALERNYDDAVYYPPESNIQWIRVHETLVKYILNPVEDWEFEVLSIFTTKSIDELKQLIKDGSN